MANLNLDRNKLIESHNKQMFEKCENSSDDEGEKHEP